MDVVNTTRDGVIRLETDRVASRSTHPIETMSHSNVPSSLAGVDIQIARKITAALTHALPLEAVLAEITALLGEAYGVQACVISLQAEPYLRSLNSWFADSQLTTSQQDEVLANYDLIKSATFARSSLLISDLTLDEIDHSAKALPIRAVMSLPIWFQGQVNGVISLMSTQTQCWTDLEIDTLTAVTNQLAVAVAQLSLQGKVTKQSQSQALLREVSIAIQNSLDVPQIQTMALEGLAQTLEIDQAFVLRTKFWDPRQNMRAKSEGHGSRDRVPKARVMIDSQWRREPIALEQAETPLSQSFWVTDCAVCQVAFLSAAKSFVFNHAAEFPSGLETSLIFNPEQMPALLLVPLESKNRLLGFIALQQKNSRTWQSEEIELVELVSAQISSAIIQTETLRQVESLVEERTSQLQQSLELQAKLYEITRKQIEKLREMNQRMDEFLSTLSHELRTPLTSMMLAIRMLRQANLPLERRQQYLNILEQQCAQETSLINDLLALQELETKQVAFQLQRVNLQSLIDDLSNSFNQRWESKGLTLEIDLPQRSLVFNTDLNSFNRILLELLTNAGKYADPNSMIHLQVTSQPGQQVQVAISNVGSAISDQELPHIFEKFRRCQGMTQNAVPGTGLGLALVKSLVQHLNGTIEVTSTELEGTQSYETCFTMTLPLNLEIADV